MRPSNTYWAPFRCGMSAVAHREGTVAITINGRGGIRTGSNPALKPSEQQTRVRCNTFCFAAKTARY